MENTPVGDGEATPSVLRELDVSQQQMVELLAEVFFTHEDWPTFQHVQARFDQTDSGVDAAAILSSFPAIGNRDLNHSRRYAAVWAENAGGAIHEAGRIGLTVVGLAQCRGTFASSAKPWTEYFLTVLRYFVQARRAFVPPPTMVEQLWITDGDIRDYLRSQRRGHGWDPALMYRVMEHEPAMYGSAQSGSSETPWRWEPRREVLAFDGVDTIEGYVRCVERLLTPPALVAQRAVPSPFDLVAALDYLDAVWRITHGRDNHLVVYPRAQAVASLTHPANTADEFASKLSALTDVFKNLRIPPGGTQSGGHPLQRLAAYLATELEPESHARVSAELEVLRAVTRTRHGLQHAGADTDGIAALNELGLGYPIMDWTASWETIRGRTINALDAIREELARLAD
jgi:hypothetical protein